MVLKFLENVSPSLHIVNIICIEYIIGNESYVGLYYIAVFLSFNSLNISM